MNVETQADIERLMVERKISFVFRPCITEQPDGTWVALYPAADWSVIGRDADDASGYTLNSWPGCVTPTVPIGRLMPSVGTSRKGRSTVFTAI